MKETVPMVRYIARLHGYYPADPLEAFRNDWFAEIYQGILNTIYYGKKSSAGAKKAVEVGLPEFFKKIEEYCKEGWLIGDGSKIYMCDFYIGSIYSDLFVNKKSWLTDKHRE